MPKSSRVRRTKAICLRNCLNSAYVIMDVNIQDGGAKCMNLKTKKYCYLFCFCVVAVDAYEHWIVRHGQSDCLWDDRVNLVAISVKAHSHFSLFLNSVELTSYRHLYSGQRSTSLSSNIASASNSFCAAILDVYFHYYACAVQTNPQADSFRSPHTGRFWHVRQKLLNMNNSWIFLKKTLKKIQKKILKKKLGKNFLSKLFPKFFSNFFPKFLKISQKNFEKKFGKKNLKKKFEKKFWKKNLKKNLGKSFDKKFSPNFFLKIFSWIFFQDFFLKHSWIIMNYSWIFMNIMNYSWISQIFFQNFFPNFFSKFFPQNFFSEFFFQTFLSKFSSKFFRDLFRGFRTRDTRVLRPPHAGFFSWLYERIFCQFFFPNFFVKIFLKIFSGFVLRVSHARHTRVASTPRGIFLVIIWMKNSKKKFGKTIWEIHE